MFGLFKSSPKPIAVEDKVWISHRAKLAACRSMLELQSATLFVVWFEDSFHELVSTLGLADGQSNVVFAKDLPLITTTGRMFVFAEHYPLPDPEQHIFSRLNLKDVPVLSAMDEPLLKFFGGDRLIEIIKKLGMQEHEVIAHSMVNKSIQNAQRKLSEKIKNENSAKSQEEWFRLNVEKDE